MIPKVIRSFLQLFVKKGKENIKLSEKIEIIGSDENLTNDEVLY